MSGQATMTVDWLDWLNRWRRQQEGYLSHRAERFKIMLDSIAWQRGEGALKLIDLCCGPGSISELALQRFPQADIVAVDIDPWLIEMGRQTLGMGRQVTWLEADLRYDDWTQNLQAGSFDAVFTATAIHWFQPEELVRLYRNLAQLLAQGGLFLNADHLPLGSPVIDRLNEQLCQSRQQAHFARGGAEDWNQYWNAVQSEAAFTDLLKERTRRFAGRREGTVLPIDWHSETLKIAGFQEADEIWRYLNDAIMVAMR